MWALHQMFVTCQRLPFLCHVTFLWLYTQRITFNVTCCQVTESGDSLSLKGISMLGDNEEDERINLEDAILKKNTQEPQILPYSNLKEEDIEEFEIISKKEEKLRRYEQVLTILMAGALVICIGLITYLTAIMAEAQSGDMTEFASNAFATNLFGVLKKTEGNVFFSPYSLQVALAMTYAGAGGNTAKELQKCFSFSEKKDAVYKAFLSTSSSLKSSGNVTLNVANGMFLQQDYQVKPQFSKDLTTVFEAEAKKVDFGNSAKSAGEINSFVNKKTNGKIPELFAPNAFNSLTKLVLVNAIYFKGSWVNQFDENDTFKGDFFLNSKDKVQVDYMTITKKFSAGENEALKATIVELPYEGELNMVLVVPNEIEGIKHLEENIGKIDLKTLTQETYTKEVHLTMPKFKLEQKMNLKETLQKLGLNDMFSQNTADFSGITDSNDLYVSEVVQKAYIEVNEKGSEAAAATAVRFVMRMMPVPPEEVFIKGPFLFFVRHAQGPILFAGRVSRP